jgi:hypothetical protein
VLSLPNTTIMPLTSLRGWNSIVPFHPASLDDASVSFSITLGGFFEFVLSWPQDLKNSGERQHTRQRCSRAL